MAHQSDAATAIGARIRNRRDEAGISLDTFHVEICQRLPRSLWISTETLRRLERGGRLPDPVILSAIADVLDVTTEDLAPEMQKELREVRDLLTLRTGCIQLAFSAA